MEPLNALKCTRCQGACQRGCEVAYAPGTVIRGVAWVCLPALLGFVSGALLGAQWHGETTAVGWALTGALVGLATTGLHFKRTRGKGMLSQGRNFEP